MQDTLVIFYDGVVLVVLTNVKVVSPNKIEILDWYANVYAFERKKLNAVWTQSISVENMKYEDYQNEREVN